jgi:hypothetical protein
VRGSTTVRVATTCGAIVALATVVVGCGGAGEHRFTRGDALRLANVQPLAPGWSWPHNPTEPRWSGSTSKPPVSTDAALAEFRRKTVNLAALGDASKKWEDSDKLGNLDIGVYGSADDAHKAIGPFDTFSRQMGERTGRVVDARAVEGVGDEAWRLIVSGNGPQVTYHWRRGNLVVEAHVHCFGACPADVDAAARAWVDAIDAAAKATS